jgi:hypothetical protein
MFINILSTTLAAQRISSPAAVLAHGEMHTNAKAVFQTALTRAESCQVQLALGPNQVLSQSSGVQRAIA